MLDSLSTLFQLFQSNPVFTFIFQTLGITALGVISLFFGELVHHKDSRKNSAFNKTVNGFIYLVLLVFIPITFVYSIFFQLYLPSLTVLVNLLLLYLIMFGLYLFAYKESTNKPVLGRIKDLFKPKNVYNFILFIVHTVGIILYYTILTTPKIHLFIIVASTAIMMLLFVYGAINYGVKPDPMIVTVTLTKGKQETGTLFKWNDGLVTLQQPNGKVSILEDQIISVKPAKPTQPF